MEKMNPEQSQGQKTDRRQLPTQNWTGKSGENVGKKPILCFFSRMYFVCEKCSQQRVVSVVRWFGFKHP